MMSDQSIRTLLRNFLIEVIVYAMLVITYFLVVLRLLNNWLARLFDGNLVFYAVLSLGLILVQGVLLDIITTFLLDWLKLERLE